MDLLQSLGNVLQALVEFAAALGAALLPWAPLAAWLAFWLLAVNWRKLYPVLMQGGMIGVVLTALMAVLVWAAVSPTAGHSLFGLNVSNIAGKGMYVFGLLAIAFFCGSVQLSGACDGCLRFEDPAPEPDHAGGHH